MSVINATPLLAAAGGDYQISRSVRLRSSASAYFNRTPASAGNRKTWTWSGWVKRGKLAANSPFINAGLISGTYYYTQVYFDTSDCLVFANYSDSNTGWLTTAQVFRDPSAWYHIVVVYDSTNATSTDRMRVHVNGTRVTNFIAGSFPVTYPSQNVDSMLNTTSYANNIGKDTNGGGGAYFDGYLTEVNFIDGQALTPSSFGETDSITGVWKPKKYAGTYGTNGFYLNFSDNSSNTATTIGKDYSGNGNNWTPNNISVTAGVTYDSMLDVPTLYADGGNGRGNYAVLNPLKNFGTTLSAANLQGAFTPATAAAWQVHGSMAMTSGKWYWEVFLVSAPTTNGIGIGVALDTANVTTQNFTSGAGWLYYTQNGNKYNTGAAAYGSSSTTNDVIGIALDMDAGTLTFYKNNVSQGQAFSGLSGKSLVALIGYDQSGTSSFAINFGQRPFAYTPPSGFKALNTLNLPEPTIKKGNQYFDAKLWSGTGSSRSITGYAFAPDFVWIKGRSIATQHALFNTITGNTKILHTNSTSAEDTRTDQLTSFNSDGFSLGTDSADGWSNYVDGRTYVGWAWKESPSAGFDIVTYTGTGSATTVAHSLGVAPSMMIVKSRSTTWNWITGWAALGWGNYINLNSTGAAGAGSTIWNNTAPTSSVFSLGTDNNINQSGQTYVAYLFAEVAGFSKFGSYVGNGSSTDGPFVFTGFRPRWVLIKNASASEQWYLVDTARDLSNPSGLHLYPNLSNAEFSPASSFPIDILSNGFKVRTASAGWSTNGQTYIYACFAENPFKNSLAR